MWLRSATYADVDAVCDNLSQISADEMAKAGVQHRWHVKKRAKICKDQGFLHVGLKGDTPICIFGSIPYDTNVMRTWFIGSDEYFDKSPVTIRDSAKHIAKIAKAFPHFTFESFSLSDNPAVLKWFRALGFRFAESLPGGMRRFRFVGRNSTNDKECATYMS